MQPQPMYDNGLNEDYAAFAAQGAAALAESVSQQAALAAEDVRQRRPNYPPPANTPTTGDDPHAGPSPQP